MRAGVDIERVAGRVMTWRAEHEKGKNAKGSGDGEGKGKADKGKWGK